MLSRTTKRDNMFILGGIEAKDFTPVMPALSTLDAEALAQLPEEARAFLRGLEDQQDQGEPQ